MGRIKIESEIITQISYKFKNISDLLNCMSGEVGQLINSLDWEIRYQAKVMALAQEWINANKLSKT